jgi:phospholipid/cholesterol/gamma-HCH transport system substrate-binding protein
MSKRLTRHDLSLEFAVGAFFFLALVLLAYFTVILNRDNLVGARESVQMRFPEVAGLSEGDAVLARGVQVGVVDQLELDDGGVTVTVSLANPLSIRDGYSVDIRFSSILGGRYVALSPGPEAAPELEPGTVLTGDAPADFMADASEMMDTLSQEISNLRSTLDEGGLLENVSAFAADMKAISSDIRAGKGSLGKLVNDPELYENARSAADELANAGKKIQEVGAVFQETLDEAREGRGTLGKLLTDDELYDNANTILADLKAGKGTLGKLLNDEAAYEEIRAFSANLRELTDKLNTGDSSLARLMADDGELFEQLRASMEATAEITRRIRDGEGTLGKLITDEAVYEDAKRTITEIRSAIEDLREQAPMATFGSFIFGAL